jgi:hypothetical protein
MMDAKSENFEHKGNKGNVHRYDSELWEAAIYRPGYGVVYGAAKTPELAVEKAKYAFDKMDWSKVKRKRSY